MNSRILYLGLITILSVAIIALLLNPIPAKEKTAPILEKGLPQSSALSIGNSLNIAKDILKTVQDPEIELTNKKLISICFQLGQFTESLKSINYQLKSNSSLMNQIRYIQEIALNQIDPSCDKKIPTLTARTKLKWKAELISRLTTIAQSLKSIRDLYHPNHSEG